MEKLSPQEVQQVFNSIRKDAQELHYIECTASDKEYHPKMVAMTERLKKFLYQDFSVLSGRDILILCLLVSKYRPVQPFSFLVTCSMLVDKPKNSTK